MPEQSIRFGIKNDNGQRAATWKCVIPKNTGKNDIYLICRKLGGAMKTSLHESGEWHTAYHQRFFDDNVPDEHKDKRGRFIEKWGRPVDIADGYTLAMRIVTPYSSVNIDFDESNFKKACWIPNAPAGQATEICLIITKQNVKVVGWSGKKSMGTQFIGSMELDSGDTIWLVYSYIAMPNLGSHTVNPKFYKGRYPKDLEKSVLRALVFGEHQDGSRVIYDTVIQNSKANE